MPRAERGRDRRLGAVGGPSRGGAAQGRACAGAHSAGRAPEAGEFSQTKLARGGLFIYLLGSTLRQPSSLLCLDGKRVNRHGVQMQLSLESRVLQAYHIWLHCRLLWVKKARAACDHVGRRPSGGSGVGHRPCRGPAGQGGRRQASPEGRWAAHRGAQARDCGAWCAQTLARLGQLLEYAERPNVVGLACKVRRRLLRDEVARRAGVGHMLPPARHGVHGKAAGRHGCYQGVQGSHGRSRAQQHRHPVVHDTVHASPLSVSAGSAGSPGLLSHSAALVSFRST